MNLARKAYNFYRNIRSRRLLFFNHIIYKDRFKTGDGVYVRKGFSVVIEEKGTVIIGTNVFFNNYCSINSLYGITIGNDCIFGENVHIYDHNHIYKAKNIPINNQGFTYGEIVIGNNCWIGSNVTILKGVSIGDHCVIGAGNIVYRDVPSNSIMVNQQMKQMVDEDNE